MPRNLRPKRSFRTTPSGSVTTFSSCSAGSPHQRTTSGVAQARQIRQRDRPEPIGLGIAEHDFRSASLLRKSKHGHTFGSPSNMYDFKSKNSKANQIETGERSDGIWRNLFGGSREK